MSAFVRTAGEVWGCRARETGTASAKSSLRRFGFCEKRFPRIGPGCLLVAWHAQQLLQRQRGRLLARERAAGLAGSRVGVVPEGCPKRGDQVVIVRLLRRGEVEKRYLTQRRG